MRDTNELMPLVLIAIIFTIVGFVFLKMVSCETRNQEINLEIKKIQTECIKNTSALESHKCKEIHSLERKL